MSMYPPQPVPEGPMKDVSDRAKAPVPTPHRLTEGSNPKPKGLIALEGLKSYG